MNILFFSLTKISGYQQGGMYPEILKEFEKNGHRIYCVSVAERRLKEPTQLVCENNSSFLTVKTLNIQKTNLAEKGIGMLCLTGQLKRAVKKYLKGITFDLILYPTPPVTLYGAVKYFKHRDHARTYLMLKDIFPQNSVDIGLMTKTGAKGLLYRYFRSIEKKLYEVSDYIGCMSPANTAYINAHNPGLEHKLELCPNAVAPADYSPGRDGIREMRRKYGLPEDKKIFVYGGNLGKPQGVPFLIECLRLAGTQTDAFFLVVGNGTEYKKLHAFYEKKETPNFKLLQRLPREDFHRMIAACDVGLIFLDYRFTIPNFPSRLLSYMQVGIPVIACTDENTDVGSVITEGGFGWWVPSNSPEAFLEVVDAALHSDCGALGARGKAYLEQNYTTEQTYQTIMKHF